MTHAPQFSFKRCLDQGAAQHLLGKVYACARKGEACNVKVQCEGREFCRTPLKETLQRKKTEKLISVAPTTN